VHSNDDVTFAHFLAGEWARRRHGVLSSNQEHGRPSHNKTVSAAQRFRAAWSAYTM
jgi:hypothetical protein